MKTEKCEAREWLKCAGLAFVALLIMIGSWNLGNAIVKSFCNFRNKMDSVDPYLGNYVSNSLDGMDKRVGREDCRIDNIEEILKKKFPQEFPKKSKVRNDGWVSVIPSTFN